MSSFSPNPRNWTIPFGQNFLKLNKKTRAIKSLLFYIISIFQGYRTFIIQMKIYRQCKISTQHISDDNFRLKLKRNIFRK